jgi:UDP-N-acetylmuramate dehydrogenase
MTMIRENVDLLPFNTFNISVKARYFTSITSVDEAKTVFQSDIFKNHRHLLLGGGSNILLTGDFDGVVIKNELKGIEIVDENDKRVT